MQRKLPALAGIAALTLSGVIALAEERAAERGDSSQQQSQVGQEQRQDPSHDRSSPAGTQQPSQAQAPEGFVLIEERIVFLMASAPQQHLLASLEKLHQNNPRAAAGEIRQSAAYVEMQASRAKGDSRQQLKEAARQLNQLADDIAQNTQKVSPQQVTKAFAKTGHALARHHQALAERALENNKPVAAGYELEAAARGLQQALVWSGERPDQDTTGTLQSAIAVAFSLRNEKFPAEEQQPEQQSQQQQADQGQTTAEDQAQPAAARQPAQQQPDPRIGTTPAEQQNIQQHARKVLDGLDKDIQELGSKIEQSGQGSGQSQQNEGQQQQDASQQQQGTGQQQQDQQE